MIEEKFMRIALKEANKAKEKDEVPIGAVIVFDDKVIAKAKGKTLKNAEQQCAKIALEEYEIEV